jgi:hypothetical protein
MVVVGADVHKRTHTFVAVDQAARELGHRTFEATTAGHQAAPTNSALVNSRRHNMLRTLSSAATRDAHLIHRSSSARFALITVS